MQIGFSLHNNGGVEDVQALVELASRAEALGFASVWVHDHVFNAGHVFTRIGRKPYYEPLTLLSYVAARTQRVGLGTSVLVLPYHNPIRLAKTAATLDVLSGGRLTPAKAPYPPVDRWEQPRRYSAGGAPGQWLASVRPLAGGVAPRHRLPAGAGPGCREGCHGDPGLCQSAVGSPDGPWGRVGHRPGSDLQKAQAFASLGVQMLVIPGHTGDMAEILPAMDMLAREVLPVFR
jgi:hypothetical protein